ncbi:MAG: linear primary-alkylsulfatase [Acidimicrobiaceae bacterium]
MSGSLEPKPASVATAAAQAAVAAALPISDTHDHELATRGHLAPPLANVVEGRWGLPARDLDANDFLAADCPDSVNPSLWRQASLNRHAGLFEVADGFYQVRGLDLSNVTFIAGDRGWVVIDPLTTTETAAAALELVGSRLGARPVTAVLYTHSHIDHFGGVLGVVSRDAVTADEVPVYAPEGFLHAAISENVIAGTAMTRRATYMYGTLLPRSPLGQVDAGLGKAVPALGTNGLIAPTHDISTTGTELVIDGVRVVFQVTPDTEAPAEMNFLFPDRRILCMAENCTATLHNLYTPRGAQVRDSLAWAHYINEAIELFADRSDTLFASHHWPRWGAAEVRRFLGNQRDVYRYLHDQTMRLANLGYTPTEIAEEVGLPDDLRTEFSNRGYYGTVSHNVKAVYQKYLGWFDGNPANLDPLPPSAAGAKYVEFKGGADEVLRRARACFDDGEYRWVAQVVNHVVFADPDNMDARALQADALEQLGYQAESAVWRNFYLTAAQEVRNGPPVLPGVTQSSELNQAMTPAMALDYLGVRLNGPRAAGVRLSFTLELEGHEPIALGVQNGTIHYVEGRPAVDPDATVRASDAAFLDFVFGRITHHDLEVDGDAAALEQLAGLLDSFELFFPIVTP